MGNLRKYVSSDASEKMKSTMKYQVLGYIRDYDPAIMSELILTCKDQVTDANEFDDFVLSILIDDILNQLITEGKITLESCLNDNNVTYSITFRIVV